MHLQLDLHPAPPPSETTVVVAMSGGVDSSVVAARLVEAGYRVRGVMLRLWTDPFADMDMARENRCCTMESVSDARRIAEQLAIPFKLLHVEDLFRETVVEYFIGEYSRGRTPNPCLLCNRRVRFDYLLSYVQREMGADFLATGHYARLRHTPEGVQLLRGIDARKDQSYVLSQIPQEKLRHLTFPVGHLTKPEVRKLARHYQLQVAEKRDSQDLCFVGGDYRQFLKRWAPAASRPGPILDMTGRQLGEHQGLGFYTIGQRKGLGLQTAERLFVIALDAERNAVVVGPAEALGRDYLRAGRINWIQRPPKAPIQVTAKIRYKSIDHPATVTPLGEGQAEVSFSEAVRDITPGQAIAFYVEERCLGGGIIEE